MSEITVSFCTEKYKLVPIEATDAMAVAAIGASLGNEQQINGLNYYAAMLAAVPAIQPGVVVHEGEPFAHFQMNRGWNSYEEVIPSAAGSEGVIAAYTHPPKPAQDDAALIDLIRQAKVALDTCAIGGYRDIDGDKHKTWWFDEAQIKAAIAAIASLNGTRRNNGR